MGKTKTDSFGKKEAGNARKAEQAAIKALEAAKREEAEEADKWSKGSKSNSKKEAAAAKKAEQARKKAERDALLEEEVKSLPQRGSAKNVKHAQKKTRGLDLSQLDDSNGGSSGSGKDTLKSLNASGIDNALDALEITAKSNHSQIDRHPERRFPAALAKFEARRLEEVKADKSMDGLRQDQKKQRIKKEFERSDENPFNQLHAAHNATQEQMAAIQEARNKTIENRLGS